MSWNYRLIKHLDDENKFNYEGESRDWYGIHGVCYTKTGKIKYWSIDPMDVSGVTAQETADTLEMMKEAFRQDRLIFYKWFTVCKWRYTCIDAMIQPT